VTHSVSQSLCLSLSLSHTHTHTVTLNSTQRSHPPTYVRRGHAPTVSVKTGKSPRPWGKRPVANETQSGEEGRVGHKSRWSGIEGNPKIAHQISFLCSQSFRGFKTNSGIHHSSQCSRGKVNTMRTGKTQHTPLKGLPVGP
jgi:hypothetical protein